MRMLPIRLTKSVRWPRCSVVLLPKRVNLEHLTTLPSWKKKNAVTRKEKRSSNNEVRNRLFPPIRIIHQIRSASLILKL